MSFTDLLTIAIPCYERKEYFLEALESALNQTVKCQIIVVDNCSSHDFFKTVSEEKGVAYYRNETNIGLFPNINRCYELADTEYVKILDDDDLLLPTYVVSFLKAHNLHPEIDVFYSDYKILSSEGETTHEEIFPYGYMENGIKIIDYGIKYRLGFPYMTATVKKRKAQLDLDSNLCVGGYDWVWVYSKAEQLSFFGDSQKLHKYRMHGKKASRGKDWSANLLTYSYIYEKIIAAKTSNPTLIKKVSDTAFRELIYLKSYGQLKNLKLIMNDDNRFGNYLKVKLNNSLTLRIIFILPQKLVWLGFLFYRKMDKFFCKTQRLKNDAIFQ